MSNAILTDIFREYHFHVYWNESNLLQKQAAMQLHELVQNEVDAGHIVARILRINVVPVGPHPTASFQVSSATNYSALTPNIRRL
jgi:aromatic ring-cleaving dioxygenase